MKKISPCVACPMSNVGFCGAVFGSTGSVGTTETSDWQKHTLIPEGKEVFAANEASPDIYILCAGWGFRFLQTSDGRRQILDFLLPGDLLTGTLFRERPHFSVRALTAIQVSTMKRLEVHARVAQDLKILWAAAENCAAETQALENMIAVLGRFSAEQRIAYLLLHLTKRFASRNVIRDGRYALPLRQQHIADAVGLTPVHVSRVLGVFRERGIADLSNGVLEVLDMSELRRLGTLK